MLRDTSRANRDVPNHRRLAFPVADFKRSFFTLKGRPSAFDVLPYLRKLPAATFDPMHTVLLGVMRCAMRDLLMEGMFGDSTTAAAPLPRLTKRDKEKATATQKNLIDVGLGSANSGPSAADLSHLQDVLQRQENDSLKKEQAARRAKFGIFRTCDAVELDRIMAEVSSSQIHHLPQEPELMNTFG